MAKAFYTQDEAKAALGTDEDGLKALTREGRLTEYRDGPRIMYKGSQIEGLAGERGDQVGLSDTGGPIGLVDSGGGSAIGLADSSARGGSAAGRSGTGARVAKDDTAAGLDLGGSMGGSGKFDPGASGSGITIFGPDDSMADPMAQTAIGDEQVNLEGIGSGSGLLDLTQEPDDTSFGAETFDEIMPGDSMGGTRVGGALDDAGIDTGVLPAGTRRAGLVIEQADPTAPIFGGLAAGAAVFVILGILAVALAASGGGPGMLSMFRDDTGQTATAVLLGVALGLPIIGAIIGFVGGKLFAGT